MKVFLKLSIFCAVKPVFVKRVWFLLCGFLMLLNFYCNMDVSDCTSIVEIKKINFTHIDVSKLEAYLDIHIKAMKYKYVLVHEVQSIEKQPQSYIWVMSHSSLNTSTFLGEIDLEGNSRNQFINLRPYTDYNEVFQLENVDYTKLKALNKYEKALSEIAINPENKKDCISIRKAIKAGLLTPKAKRDAEKIIAPELYRLLSKIED